MGNKEQKTRKFEVGDRVRVRGHLADGYLQRDNRIGTIVEFRDNLAYLEMDEKVKEDRWHENRVKIADGHRYCAFISELRKIKKEG